MEQVPWVIGIAETSLVDKTLQQVKSLRCRHAALKTVSKSGISLVHATVHRSKQISWVIRVTVSPFNQVIPVHRERLSILSQSQEDSSGGEDGGGEPHGA